jgi:hypothetical protein
MWSLRQTAIEIKHDLGGLTSQVSTTLAQVNSTELQTSGRLAEEQKQFGETLVALKHMVQRADEQLYGRDLKSGLFGQVRDLLDHGNVLLVDTDAATRQATVTLAQASTDLHATLLELQPSLDALAKQLGDPAIAQTLKNLETSSANLSTDTEQLGMLLKSASATAEDVRLVADSVREKYLKTRNLAYALFRELLTVGSQGIQFLMKK